MDHLTYFNILLTLFCIIHRMMCYLQIYQQKNHHINILNYHKKKNFLAIMASIIH